MSKNRAASRKFEGALQLLDGAIGLGLISGTAVAIFVGKFILGGILAVLALGVFFRFTRRSSKK